MHTRNRLYCSLDTPLAGHTVESTRSVTSCVELTAFLATNGAGRFTISSRRELPRSAEEGFKVKLARLFLLEVSASSREARVMR